MPWQTSREELIAGIFPRMHRRRSRFSDFVVRRRRRPAGRLTCPSLPSYGAAGEPKMRSASLAVAVLAAAALLPGTHRARAADGFDLVVLGALGGIEDGNLSASLIHPHGDDRAVACDAGRSEEHTSELQSRQYLVC